MEIYTDGSSKEDATGGYGIFMRHEGEDILVYGGFVSTTNNRMEMFAVIRSLEITLSAIESNEIQECKVINLYSDSSLVCKGMTEWIHKWKKNNWKGSNSSPVKNCDLWERLDGLKTSLTSLNVEVNFIWVKGHSDNEGNNLVDRLAHLGAVSVKELRKDFESYMYDIS